VLLIGDSITRGYFGEVEKHLTGKAHCARLTTSKCVSDPSFLDEVQLFLKQYRFAVVHFNGRGKEAQAKQVAESVLKCLPTGR
jgi:hypothetical protein